MRVSRRPSGILPPFIEQAPPACPVRTWARTRARGCAASSLAPRCHARTLSDYGSQALCRESAVQHHGSGSDDALLAGGDGRERARHARHGHRPGARVRLRPDGTDAEAEKAITEFHEYQMQGRPLVVNEAKPKPEFAAGAGRGGSAGGGGDFGGGGGGDYGGGGGRGREPRWWPADRCARRLRRPATLLVDQPAVAQTDDPISVRRVRLVAVWRPALRPGSPVCVRLLFATLARRGAHAGLRATGAGVIRRPASRRADG